MSYTVHNFATGGTVKASDFNEMDAQIAANEAAVAQKQWTKSVVTTTEEQLKIALTLTDNITEFIAKVTTPALTNYTNCNVYAAFGNASGSNANAWVGETLMSTSSPEYFTFYGEIRSNVGFIKYTASGNAAARAGKLSACVHDSFFEVNASTVKGVIIQCSSASKFPVGTVVTFYYR